MESRPADSLGRRLDAAVARYVDTELPAPRGLSRGVAPLPAWLENIGLRLAWPIAVINIIGAGFGFLYYWPQLQATPLVAWPLVPVSPLATLYIGLSLIAWRLEVGAIAEPLHMLAFFGSLKYGLWTPFVQLWINGPGLIEPWLYVFLIVSHLGMVLQAFLIHRYASFSVWAVAVGAGWYVLNDVVDYFIAVLGGPHHTWVVAVRTADGIDRSIAAFDQMAAAAVVTTALGIFLALATRVAIVESRTVRR
jgi:Predicted membrane protein